MSKALSRSLAAWFAVLLFAVPATAQDPTLTCSTPVEPATPGACTLKATTNPGQHSVTVQINNAIGVTNTPVEFTVEEPGRTIKANSPAGADGKATFSWFGAAGTGVKVTAKATIAGRTLTRVIDVNAPAAASTQRSLAPLSDSVVYGYEKRQIKAPVIVEIQDAGERCDSAVVVFRAYGAVGAGSPDSVRAVRSSGRCAASTWWRLGEGVGRQHLRASLADEPAKDLVLSAVARATPRLNAGIVSTYDFRHYDRVDQTERTIHITRRVVDPVTGDSATVVTDSTAKTISVTEVDGEAFTKPVVSVDFPILARWTRLRASLGAAFENADTDWYVGISALQPFRGVSQEAVGADFHAVIHLGRRDVLKDPKCDDDGNTSDCKSKKEFILPLGIGFMATFDATSLLSALGSIFP
ncbi:MAG TPA: hypothetical protein VFT45_05280 [Longimicrobium sp.]|nr:hypothetical protein [Longimicrobium sp.]